MSEEELPENINTIVSAIKREQEGIISVVEEGEPTVTEYGSLICLIDNKVILEGWHKGEEWGGVKVKKECKAGRRVGTIHTHPSVWLPELSVGDFLNILLNEDSIAFLAYKKPGIGGYYKCDAYIFDKMSPIYTKLTKKARDYRDGKISEAEISDIVSRQIRMVYDKEIVFYKKLERKEREEKEKLNPEGVKLIKSDYSKFLAEGNYPLAAFLDYAMTHRGEPMSSKIAEVLKTLEEADYDKEKIEIIRGWFT